MASLTFSRKCPFYVLKQAQNSEFAYYASKSGKWRKRKPTPPLWGGCWREKVVSEFGFGHSKYYFRAPENGHFWKRPKNLFFFAFLVVIHIDTTYIKWEWNSENFLIFWCALMDMSNWLLWKPPKEKLTPAYFNWLPLKPLFWVPIS